MSTVKSPNEEYEGVLAPEELQTLQQIYDREINSNRNQDTYPFYEGERGAYEEKWIAKMEQSLQLHEGRITDDATYGTSH